MSIVHVDIETRSETDLSVGVYRYAPAAEILCVAWAIDDGPVSLSIGGGEPDELREALDNGAEFCAHNAAFERIVLSTHWRAAWKDPFNWRCTAALAAYHALPRSLDGATAALRLAARKDADGHALMLRMCRPAARDTGMSDLFGTGYLDDAESMRRLGEYCRADVVAEREIHDTLPPMTGHELSVWRVDQYINDIGFPVDTRYAAFGAKLGAKVREALDRRARELGAPVGATQRQAFANWLREHHGVELRDTSRAVVQRAIAARPDKRAELELMRDASRTTAKKFDAMLSAASSDGRIRGAFMYGGAATTLRWAGRAVQPHNFPRGDDCPYVTEDVTRAYGLMATCREPDGGVIARGGPAYLGAVLRGAIAPRPPYTLAVADLSSIECRVLFALARHTQGVRRFREGADLYCEMATELYGYPVRKGSKERVLGKAAVLALGYGMGPGTFLVSCDAQGLTFAEKDCAAIVGAEMKDYVRRVKQALDSPDRSRYITAPLASVGMSTHDYLPQLALMFYAVDAYRRVHHPVPAAWERFRGDARRAVSEGTAESWHMERISGVDCLTYTLPSGRPLRYWAPEIDERDNGITFRNHRGHRAKLWGPKIVEHICQATARDVLARALVRVYDEGFDTVLHVHDEIAVECRDTNATRTLNELIAIMTEQPPWLPDVPLSADGDLMVRYRK